MAIFNHDCPHCRSPKMTFVLFGAKAAKTHSYVGAIAAAECQQCSKPVSAILVHSGNSYDSHFSHLLSGLAPIATLNFQLQEFWPEPAVPVVPEHLPTKVARAFGQGDFNLTAPGNEEAAATMYRRALDLALQIAFPEEKGDLRPRITALVKKGALPVAIGDWAHQVRITGNDGAHDLDGCSSDDAQAARGFVDAVLRYTFSFPQMVAQRRGIPIDELTTLPSAAR